MAAASNPPAEIDGVHRWLMSHVNDAVPASCIEIIMLGMRTELTQNALDSVRKTSDLYFLLERLNIYETKDELVARFIYALELLKRNTVNDAIANLPQEFEPSAPFDPLRQSQEFQFHQTLVKICIGLRDDQPRKRRVINYCSHVSGMSSKDYKLRIHTLILKLLQKGLITHEDQTILAKGLVSVHAYDCFRMIQKYRTVNGLQEMDLEAIKTEVELTIQGNPKLVSESELTDSLPQPLRSYAGSVTESTDRSSSFERPTTEHPTVQNRGTPSSVHHEEYYEIGSSARKESELQLENPPRNGVPKRRPTIAHCCCSTIAVLILILAALLGLLFAGITGYSIKSLPKVHLYYGNSSDSAIVRVVNDSNVTVILSQVEHFITKKATIEQQSKLNDAHEIFLYQFHKKCSSIQQFNQSPTAYTGSSTLSSFNKFCAVVIFYLHEGAEINLNVCAKPNSSAAETDGTSFRVMLDNYEETETCSNQKTKEILTFDSSDCKPVQNYSIKHDDYYAIRFFTQSVEWNYNYTLELIDQDIDVSLAQSSRQLLDDEQTYNFSFSSAKSCIVAELRPKSYNTSQGVVGVDLSVTFKPWPVWTKVVGFSIASGMFILVLVMCVYLCVRCCKRRHRSNIYVRVAQDDS